MKHIYLLLTLAFALSIPAKGQLSGTVTIDDGAPSSATNYTSFTALAGTLNAVGINGQLVVNVMPGSGPYHEQVEFMPITGVSATNQIFVNGNGCVLTYSATSSALPWIMRLNGTDRLNLNNLNIVGTGSYCYCCDLTNGADYNTFSACNFSASVTGTASSQQVPVSIGRFNGPSAKQGNYNQFSYCGIYGGYAGIVDWSNSVPYNTANEFFNCKVTDFYMYGVASRGTLKMAVKFCTFDRPTRPIVSGAIYGVYTNSVAAALLEGNTIQNLTGGSPSFTGTTYGIYSYSHALPTGIAADIVRNNIISCQTSNGTVYGIAGLYTDAHYLHNTIYIDDQTATANVSSYGMYLSSSSTSDSARVKNNIVWLSRSGGGVEFGAYYNCGWGIRSDYNVIYLDSLGPNHYTAYLCGINTLAQLHAQGSDIHSYTLDPMFTPSTGCRPFPTNSAIDNQAAPLGVMLDANQAWRNMLTPDIGALESLTGPCSGTPSNSIVGPSTVCPGTSFDLLTGLSNNFSGLTLSWESSNSPNGPFVTIPNAKSVMYSESGIFADTYYQAVLTCTLPGGGTSVSTFSVKVAGTVFDTVPYFEHFETLGKNDALPNCSWLATDLGNANQTYTLPAAPGRFPLNGSGYASFFNIAPGQSQFYTNGILLKAGVTYSAAVWYNRDNSSASNFTNISIFYATSQNSTAITNINSITPVASSAYQLLDGTFTVASTGTYYIGVGAASTFSTASFLLLDDLSVTIPCQGPGSGNNGVNVSVSGPTLVCLGQNATITASGADAYQWTTGPATNSIMVTPSQTATFSVNGTNTLSGCSAGATHVVNVQNCAGISELSWGLRIYPSPFGDELTIEWMRAENRKVELLDVTGRLVYSGAVAEARTIIPTAALAKGAYTLRIAVRGEVTTHKVLKN